MCTNWECPQTLCWKHHVMKGFLWPSYLDRHCPYLLRCYSWKEGRMCNEVGGTVCLSSSVSSSWVTWGEQSSEQKMGSDAMLFISFLKKEKHEKRAKKTGLKHFCVYQQTYSYSLHFLSSCGGGASLRKYKQKIKMLAPLQFTDFKATYKKYTAATNTS